MNETKQMIVKFIARYGQLNGKAPSQREIAQAVRRSVSTVNQAVSELVEAGIIERENRRANNKKGRNIVLPKAGANSDIIDL